VAHFPKPAAGSWTENYPELGTGRVDYTDSIDPAFFEAEREAIFKRTWLNVGRIERFPRTGSYFSKELPSAGPGMSVIVVKTKDGSVKAFHNVCRHRGNKLVWNDFPRQETSCSWRQFTCKYHPCRYSLDSELIFIQQEGEFFDVDKSRYGLVPVRCEVWEGAHGPSAAQRVVRPVGPDRRDPVARSVATRCQPGQSAAVGHRFLPLLPQLHAADLGSRLVSDLSLLADHRRQAHLRAAGRETGATVPLPFAGDSWVVWERTDGVGSALGADLPIRRRPGGAGRGTARAGLVAGWYRPGDAVTGASTCLGPPAIRPPDRLVSSDSAPAGRNRGGHRRSGGNPARGHVRTRRSRLSAGQDGGRPRRADRRAALPASPRQDRLHRLARAAPPCGAHAGAGWNARQRKGTDPVGGSFAARQKICCTAGPALI
jgi:nitrite reductase/ring-hydroxylating ferredoxin subunit